MQPPSRRPAALRHLLFRHGLQVLFDIPPSALNTPAMLQLEEARRRILGAVRLLPPESVPIEEAAGRFLAGPFLAPLDLPLFDNSAMDGYAVRSKDVRAARPEAPVPLRLCGQVPAGQTVTNSVTPGTCVRVFTGSPLPAGADAVIMQEDTRIGPDKPEEVLCLGSVQRRENVRLRGEDVRRGDRLFPAGTVLTPSRLALLAASGVEQIPVGSRPYVGILATGSELMSADEPPSPGKIYESNRISLASLLASAGALPQIYPLVPDDPSAIGGALQTIFNECDVAVTTGGVSVGALDYVNQAFTDVGGQLDFWKIAMRPGKPFLFGRWQERLLFGLPGNPVSALVACLLLVRPVLLRMQGAIASDLPARPGVLAEPLLNPGDRRHFVRVILDDHGQVRSAGQQASHALLSLAAANGLVDVPPQTTFRTGTEVQVLHWQ